MSRPLRLEFENAWYHVTNQGLNSGVIFKNKQQGEIFLELLKTASQVFGIEIHAFCLMSNHYHLLIKTPRGNLSRAMRHINGVYTQQINRLENKEGPLFCGRYKAIIVEEGSYLLKVSRYIHLYPVLTNIANMPQQYKWSSYLYYVNKKEKPEWLHIDSHTEYKKFVEEGIDLETKSFYDNKKRGTIFGSHKYREKLLQSLSKETIAASKNDFLRTQQVPSMQNIIAQCIKYFNIDEDTLYKTRRGHKNYFRKIAIYACRVWGSYTLSAIAKQFHIFSHTLASNVVSEITKQMKIDEELFEDLNKIKKLIHSEV